MRLSRSKIELFQKCRRCFWLDVKAKVRQPSGPRLNFFFPGFDVSHPFWVSVPLKFS